MWRAPSSLISALQEYYVGTEQIPEYAERRWMQLCLVAFDNQNNVGSSAHGCPRF